MLNDLWVINAEQYGHSGSEYCAVRRCSEQRIASGLNQAGTHVDIVIGSPEVQIDGIHSDGSIVSIAAGDEFVLHD